MTRPSSRHLLVAAFAAIYLIWGSTYLAIRYAVEAVPPFLAIAVRCVLGAAILFAWLAARRSLARPTARQWATAALAGGLLFAAGQAVLAWAEQRVPSGSAAVLLATIPLWMVLLDAVRVRRLPAWHVLAGLTIGLLGVTLLGGNSAQAPMHDYIMLVLAAFAWALGSLVARNGLSALPAFQSTAMQLAGGGLVLILVTLGSGELAGWSPAALTLKAGGAIAYLVIGGTVIGFVAYTWLLRVVSSQAVGTYAFVNPLVALGLAWATGDEILRPATLMAATLILGGVLLMRRRSPATAAVSGHEPPAVACRACTDC